MRFICLILIGFSVGCDDTGATAEPGEDATLRPDGADGESSSDARAEDAVVDRGSDQRVVDAQPPQDGQPPIDAQLPIDARPPMDAADSLDAAEPPDPPDLGEALCHVSVANAAGTLLGRCPVPDAPSNCVTLAECLCTFPTEPTGFESCVIAISMPRALINLSDYCGNAQMSVGAVVREQGWRGTWDQGSYLLSAEPVCDTITARL